MRSLVFCFSVEVFLEVDLTDFPLSVGVLSETSPNITQTDLGSVAIQTSRRPEVLSQFLIDVIYAVHIRRGARVGMNNVFVCWITTDETF